MDFIEPEIAPFDLPTLKILERNMNEMDQPSF